MAPLVGTHCFRSQGSGDHIHRRHSIRSSMPRTSDAIARQFSGHIAPERVHRPGTRRFRDVTGLWNGAITKRPDVVVQAVSSRDVESTVRIAAENGLPLAVRSGGHDWAGRSLTTGGVVIDMSLMRNITVDIATHSVRLGGGASARDVAKAAGSAGLVPATGAIGDVGMPGHNTESLDSPIDAPIAGSG
jgi:hypothetical protein